MAITDIAIDIGSSFTSIFIKEVGLVLREPSLVLIMKNSFDMRAMKLVGDDIRQLKGKIPEDMTIISPIVGGEIIYDSAVFFMLRRFLSKVLPKKSLLKPRIRVFVNITCGAKPEEYKKIENIFYELGLKEVYILEEPIASAFNINGASPLNSPLFVVDIGGGVTSAALVGEDGIISGGSIAIGGKVVDKSIQEELKEPLGVILKQSTAEKLKMEIGSLYENDGAKTEVYGMGVVSKMPKLIEVTAKNLRGVIAYYYDRLADFIKSNIEELPQDKKNEVMKNGIYLCGGGSKIAGLEKHYEKKFLTNITIENKSELAEILGLAKLMNEPKNLAKLLKI